MKIRIFWKNPCESQSPMRKIHFRTQASPLGRKTNSRISVFPDIVDLSNTVVNINIMC